MRRPLLHPFSSAFSRFVWMSVLTLSLVLGGAFGGWPPPAHSQLPSLSSSTSPSTSDVPDDVRRYGELEVASIRSPLDDMILFDIASPTILDRDDIPEGKLPVEIRADEVNERLWRVFSRTTMAKQPPVVTIVTLNNRPVIQISIDQSSRPIRLITVTEPDADWHGKTLDELATTWKELIQAEIDRFRQLASPEVIIQRVLQASQILLGLVIASIIIWILHRLLTRRQNTLETRLQHQLDAIVEAEKTQKLDLKTESNTAVAANIEPGDAADLRSQFLATIHHQFTLKRQLEIDKFLKWTLFWIFVVMWYLGIARIMSTVPVLMRWSLNVWATPLALLALWFGISFAIRVSKSLIDRVMHSWKVNPLLPLGETQRIALRTTTIAEALKGFVSVVLVIVGIVWTCGLFNIPTSSILAGSAVIGLAISFGSQSLVKDLVNGCLILIEDQFAVGDVIEIDSKSGLVENLNLRVTQLRNSEGQLITIPNSTITTVSNLTRLWSRIDFAIVVAYENDPQHVLNVLHQVCEQLYREPEWHDRLPEPPDVLGIDEVSHTGMLVRVWIKTAPMEQWNVGREFRFRVRKAFEVNNIQIGRPQWITYNGNSPQVESEMSPEQLK